jgi:hypothetical protein
MLTVSQMNGKCKKSEIKDRNNILFYNQKRHKIITWFLDILKHSEEIIEFIYIDTTISYFDKLPELLDLDYPMLQVLTVSLLQLSLKLRLKKGNFLIKIKSVVEAILRIDGHLMTRSEINVGEIFVCNLLNWDFGIDTITQITKFCFYHLRKIFKYINKEEFIKLYLYYIEICIENFIISKIEKVNFVVAVVSLLLYHFEQNIFIDNYLIKLLKRLNSLYMIRFDIVKCILYRMKDLLEDDVNIDILDERFFLFKYYRKSFNICNLNGSCLVTSASLSDDSE